MGSLRDREVACSASDHQGTNFEGQCHLLHPTILRRFSWPSLAYMCTKDVHIHSFNSLWIWTPSSHSVWMAHQSVIWHLMICHLILVDKWNESGFRPPLCTYRLNWARRTSWGWWDEWDDTFLQTQDSKFEPWRSEAEPATSRSRRLPTILTFTRGWGRNIFVSLKPPKPGTEPRALAWKAAVLTTTLGPPPWFWLIVDLQRMHLYKSLTCYHEKIKRKIALIWSDTG